MKGEISRLVIQALREIGKDNITSGQQKKIHDLLQKEDRNNLLHDVRLAPAWIKKKVISKLLPSCI